MSEITLYTRHNPHPVPDFPWSRVCLTPQPATRNPQPEARHLKPETRNSKPEAEKAGRSRMRKVIRFRTCRG